MITEDIFTRSGKSNLGFFQGTRTDNIRMCPEGLITLFPAVAGSKKVKIKLWKNKKKGAMLLKLKTPMCAIYKNLTGTTLVGIKLLQLLPNIHICEHS